MNIMSVTKLPYLIDEICAAVEIYYTGREGMQYVRTAFILCDDYTELVAKLFLLTDDAEWSDKKKDDHFKSYHQILSDTETLFAEKRPADIIAVRDLHARMRDRRRSRNGFFHSTHLLDLSLNRRAVVEAFCDLFTYGELLFPCDWQKHVESSRNLDTMRVLLIIEKAGFSDPSLWPKAAAMIRACPRNAYSRAKVGVHLTRFPDDFHLRLCVTYGSNILRDKLKALILP